MVNVECHSESAAASVTVSDIVLDVLLSFSSKL